MECLIAEMKVLISAKVTGVSPDDSLIIVKRRVQTGKVIFEDNNLCCQFLNDYVDLPHFKDVRSEDIEDVSEEFVPLFSNEREADRIKEIKIRGESNITSFFLISLIEHKSNVEYNIHMQIFRYMVYIWERYERRMEQENPGCTRRKDFAYPPIIPIVYYEGKGRWTAPKEFKDKIMFGETFKEFLPNYSYYIVPIHDYSNETLIDHGDEISLVMLINKLQSIEDVEQFRSLPTEKVEEILKDTPDYLLDIIANVLRAFLRKENVPEEETETLVGKVKEKKMGELFANMDKMDIQAERRKTAEAEKRAEEAEKKAEEAEKKAVMEIIKMGRDCGGTKEFVTKRLCDKYGFDEKEAKGKVDLYWEN